MKAGIRTTVYETAQMRVKPCATVEEHFYCSGTYEERERALRLVSADCVMVACELAQNSSSV